jgi:hypothetical protein
VEDRCDDVMLRRVVATVFVWVAMVTFGAVLVETLLIYPNVFPDVPFDSPPRLGNLTGVLSPAAEQLVKRN